MGYWWVAVVIVLMAALMVVWAWLLRKNRKANMITLFVVSLILLIFKSIQFGIERSLHHYPIEFSHMSYFILGATMTVGVKKLRPFAGFCAFISGLAFVLGGIISPAPVVRDAENTFNWVTGIIQHEVLLFAGLSIIFNTDKYRIKDIWILIVGIAVMFIFSILVYKRVLYPDLVDKRHDNMVIIFILTGTLLEKYITHAPIHVGLKVLTIVLEMALLGVLLWGFYFVNNKFYEKRLKKYPDFVGNADEYGIIPLIKYIIKKNYDKKALLTSSASALEETRQSQVDETISKNDEVEK